jgi:hypothetical protein
MHVFLKRSLFPGGFFKRDKRYCPEGASRSTPGFHYFFRKHMPAIFLCVANKEKSKNISSLNRKAAGAYLIDFEGASRILENLKQEQDKCHTVIDWWLNSLIDIGVIKMFWAHPPVVGTGVSQWPIKLNHFQ